MQKTLACLATAIFVLMTSAPLAHAAATIFISGDGADGNSCLSPATACRNFGGATGALAKTDEGGIIHVLPGFYGAVSIDKELQIVADGGQASNNGAITVGTVQASFVVNAGATDVVRIRGFLFDRNHTTGGGIGLVTGAALYVEDCTMVSSGNDYGIQFEPSGTSELYVTNTTITDNGNPANGGGILIQPTGSASVTAVLDNVRLESNRVGLFANRSLTTGAINVIVNGSTISGNTTGIVVNQNGAAVRVSDTRITGNTNGLIPLAGGHIISHGGNLLNANATNGAFTATFPPQ